MRTVKITTTEMHTAGEPVRIVESDTLQIQGKTILDKITYIRENLDNVRKLVMHEPRGHADMFGVIVVQSDIQEADIACIFIHNGGYATMCGHVTLAVGRYAIDKGLAKSQTNPETRVVIQCPCGPVETFVEYQDGKSGASRFNSVPAFAFAMDVSVDVSGYGLVTVDIGYGGNFYAIVSAERLGLYVKTSTVADLREAGGRILDALRATVKLTHPGSGDLAFLFGVVLTDGRDECNPTESDHVVVFGDRQVDRSPCGSGSTARVAVQHARGLINLDERRTFVGPAGGKFKARVIRQTTCGPHNAVIVQVSGKAYYTGTCTFTLEASDEIGKGFCL